MENGRKTESASLPIDDYRDEFLTKFSRYKNIILRAQPGAGKTTRVPPWVMGKVEGRVLVLEPRRLAAVLSAQRVASELGFNCGSEIGYQIRFERKVSPQTRLIYMTEGILPNVILSNPALDEVDCVVLDEFHERNVQGDLSLAILRHLQTTIRPDLKIIVMSATLETDRLFEYLREPAVLDVPGRAYPVEVRYCENDHESWLVNLIASVQELLADPRCRGNILVFLSGIRDITIAREQLKNQVWNERIELLSLLSASPESEKKKIFSPSTKRKIILATNVAETSITLPGITGVIDNGLEKRSGFAHWSGMNLLDVKRISKASCIQRTGRAGRTSEGVCICLYSQRSFLERPDSTPPEIQRTDLSHLLLQMQQLKSKIDPKSSIDDDTFWLTSPSKHANDSAISLLHSLDLIDSTGTPTEIVERVLSYRMPLRVARVVFAIEEFEMKDLAADVGVLLAAEDFDRSLSNSAPDFWTRLDNFRRIMKQRPRDIDPQTKKIRSHLRTTLGVTHSSSGSVDREILRDLIVMGYPDRIAKFARKLENGSHEYHLCSGGKVILRGSPDHHEFIAILDAKESARDRKILVRSYIDVPPRVLLSSNSNLLVSESRHSWLEDTDKVVCETTVRYGNLRLSRSVSAPSPSEVARILLEALKANWPGPLKEADYFEIYANKVKLIEGYLGETDLPILEGELLQLLLLEMLEDKQNLSELATVSVKHSVQMQLSYEQQQSMLRLTPDQVVLPNGTRVPIDYSERDRPTIRVRMQDCYGMAGSPTILQGKQPLLVHLLAPNGRPLQITSDLTSFWAGAYKQVRGEMMKRYPKHFWPEDPARTSPLPPGRIRPPKDL